MRMWGINPSKLCRNHLLGEHLEMHMFIGCIKKGKSIQGYINRKQVNPYLIKQRHDELVLEMIKREYNHQSPIDYDCSDLPVFPIDIKNNEIELKQRCSNCKI